ncbi:MAG: toll/interleukin-1 receptor domain-containing protein [Ktedonobacteraceae bacterium]|nr:toll/interleukin-1 receptor domain-containing protein [Ktedonobacteraceae bacterium]
MSPLRRLRYITGWFNRDIEAGTDWERESEVHLDTASIILLLVSPDFFASDYCYTVEMQRALKKHKAGTAHVIPILLRPVAWKNTPIGELSALPFDKKPVTQWADRDEAWLNVVEGINEVIRKLLPKQSLFENRHSSLYGSRAY